MLVRSCFTFRCWLRSEHAENAVASVEARERIGNSLLSEALHLLALPPPKSAPTRTRALEEQECLVEHRSLLSFFDGFYAETVWARRRPLQFLLAQLRPRLDSVDSNEHERAQQLLHEAVASWFRQEVPQVLGVLSMSD